MANSESALAQVYHAGTRTPGPDEDIGVTIREVLGLEIVQVTAWPETFEQVSGLTQTAVGCGLPAQPNRVEESGSVKALWNAPESAFLISRAPTLLETLTEVIGADLGTVTGLAAARTVLQISGLQARWVLAKGLSVDLADAVLLPEQCFQSAVHGIPVLGQRLADSETPTFELYISRSFAETFWEWLMEASLETGCEIGEPITFE